jgi:propanol-preferring alcohol dehydrogenase
MILQKPGDSLNLIEQVVPEPGPEQILIRVKACGVCRTDLHVIDGELIDPKLPIIPGHEIVGIIEKKGNTVDRFNIGDRIGVPWLGYTCGKCSYCKSDRENLCEQASFTGYQINGGYADYTIADHRYCFSIPKDLSDAEAAPLLCAGLIGYRSLLKAGDAKRLGLYGFGAAAHIVAQIASYKGRDVYAFTRPGDLEGQDFARKLGVVWTGDSTEKPPKELDAAIIFAPAGELVPTALKVVAKGGTVVCAGIHMSDIPQFPYEILWGERTICSVANLTRRDGEEFMELAPKVPIRTSVQTFPLEEANEAIQKLKSGQIQGAAVLVMEQ